MQFEPITLDRQKEYRERLAQCPQNSSDTSFVNIWGWAEEYDLEWAWDNDLVWIRQKRPAPVRWAPVGPWQNTDWTSLDLSGEPYGRIPQTLADQWQSALGDRIVLEEAREDWDYLYATEDLAQLRGNRFHKKKNLVNQFRKKYDFSYHPFGPDLVERALAMQEQWCTWRDCESSQTLSAENRVIEKILSAWESLEGITGGAIVSEDALVAYTVAENLPDGSLLIHFEKANQDFKGAYQAINQIFVQNAGEGIDRVNREQDLGDEGLRKAKLSYHPVDFIRKYRVRAAG